MNPGHPPLETPGLGLEVPPTQGPPVKGTAAEDAQSCCARTIRLLKFATYLYKETEEQRAPWREPKTLPAALRHRHRCRGLPTEDDLRRGGVAPPACICATVL